MSVLDIDIDIVGDVDSSRSTLSSPSSSFTSMPPTPAPEVTTQTEQRRARRRPSIPHRPRSKSTSASSSCSSLPTLSALEAPTSILASVRVLVLSHLAELERRLSAADTLGGETVEEAMLWARDTLEMLRRIRSDVSAHLPDLPFDASGGGGVEELLRAHLPDALPDLHLHFPDMQTRLQDVRTHLSDISADLSQPMSYLPVLSAHLHSLHAHLAELRVEYSLPSLPSSETLSLVLDRILSSDRVPSVLHRVDGHDSPFEKAARDMSAALKKSLDGSQLVSYRDLPGEWRNNPWVSSGYRFIPLHKWPIILLSLFAFHNETLNIHTHMIPLLHTALRFISPLHYASAPLDGPEKIYTAFAMLCLFSSVVWHTMSGCAHRVGMELCARVDYVGIGWLISASVGSVVYYGFSCHSDIALAYLTLCLITGIAGSIFPFMDWFNDRKYKSMRVAFFLGMAFTGLAPLLHLSLHYSFRAMFSFVWPLAPSLLSYLIGLTFYVTHVPERFVYSARVARWTDWLGGGSHAIWHAFIVLAIYQHKWAMREVSAGVGGEGCLV